MNTLKNYVAGFVFVFCTPLLVKAQGLEDAWLQTEAQPGGLVQGTFHVYLADTLNCDEIALELGSSEHASDLLQLQFPFDTPAALPSGMSYARQGVHVQINLGNFTDSPLIWARVRNKDAGGEWSPWWSFVK